MKHYNQENFTEDEYHPGLHTYADDVKKPTFSLPEEGNYQMVLPPISKDVIYPADKSSSWEYNRLEEFDLRPDLGSPKTPEFWEKIQAEKDEKLEQLAKTRAGGPPPSEQKQADDSGDADDDE